MDAAAKVLSSPPYGLSYVLTMGGEYAWHSEDYPTILQYFLNHDYIVLGGDILTTGMQYTGDNWYYNPVPEKSTAENSQKSYDTAQRYLSLVIPKIRCQYQDSIMIVYVVIRRTT